MAEAVIGARVRDIVHQVKTREGSLTVTHNTGDFVANTLGHLAAIPTTHTILWTWDSAFRNPTRELATQLFERYRDVPWKGDVLVRVGHVDIMGDVQRIFAKNEDVRGRPWMLKGSVGRAVEYVGKAGAAILGVAVGVGAKFRRGDFYNPFSNTLTVYHPKLSVGMHELGHAEFINQMDKTNRAAYVGGLLNSIVYIPFLRSFNELKATQIAMKRFKSDVERRAGLKQLEAAWGTYLATDTLTTLALVAPALALPLLTTALKIQLAIPLGKGYVAGRALVSLLPYAGSLAGHFMNRLYPRKNERFSYVFEGIATKHAEQMKTNIFQTHAKEHAPKALSTHQVLVATAHPTGEKAYNSTHHPKLHSNTHRITF